MILFRAGYKDDKELSKGFWWSNSLWQVYPYFRGKLSVIEVDLSKLTERRYLLTREIQVLGHHNGYGKWARHISTYGEEFDENYYYLSPTALNEANIIAEIEGTKALELLKSYKKDSKIGLTNEELMNIIELNK